MLPPRSPASCRPCAGNTSPCGSHPKGPQPTHFLWKSPLRRLQPWPAVPAVPSPPHPPSHGACWLCPDVTLSLFPSPGHQGPLLRTPHSHTRPPPGVAPAELPLLAPVTLATSALSPAPAACPACWVPTPPCRLGWQTHPSLGLPRSPSAPLCGRPNGSIHCLPQTGRSGDPATAPGLRPGPRALSPFR